MRALFVASLVCLFLGLYLCCDHETPYRTGYRGSVPSVSSRKRAAALEWDYDRTGDHGPAHWAEQAPVCAGVRQSPINIPATTAAYSSSLTPLKVDYPASFPNAVIHNNGHTVQIDIPANGPQGKLSGGGLEGSYTLLQAHYHFTSEHLVNGYGGSLELHFVHLSDNVAWQGVDHPKRLAVLGVIFQEGPSSLTPSPFNAQFDSVLSKLTKEGANASLSAFNFNLPFQQLSTSNYFTYPGSLTTPPCNEVVTWFVLDGTIMLSGPQFQALATVLEGNNDFTAVAGNNRPVQPLNGRTVQKSFGAPRPEPSGTTGGDVGGASNVINVNFAGLFSGYQR